MTEQQEDEFDAAKSRRARDHQIATEKLRNAQDARMYGVISFYLQAGRIVRIVNETSEVFPALDKS